MTKTQESLKQMVYIFAYLNWYRLVPFLFKAKCKLLTIRLWRVTRFVATELVSEYELFWNGIDFDSEPIRDDFEIDLKITHKVLMLLYMYGGKDLSIKQFAKLKECLKKVEHIRVTKGLNTFIRRSLRD